MINWPFKCVHDGLDKRHPAFRRIQMAVAHVINLIDVASRVPRLHACAAALDIRA